MDASRFDALARALVSAASRRGVLGLLSSLPLGGGLAALLDADEVDAKGRRKRRKKRHKHGRPRRHGKRKGKKHQKCTPKSKAKTCAGKCGSVKNTCKKNVDCGSCACDPACDICYVCQEGPNTPGACVVDPEQQGQACGDPGQICQPSGDCACTAESCGNPTPLCVGTTCEACADATECLAAGVGNQCCGGSCFVGECCDNADCGGATPVCDVNHVCVACETHAACGEGFLCLEDGSCQACDITCADGTCAGGDLQATIASGGTVYVCPGRYTGNFILATEVTVIGAGQGDDPSVDTILDAQNNGRTVVNDPGVPASLHRLRITGGRFRGSAGLRNQGGQLTVTDCTITGNTSVNASSGGVGNVLDGVLQMTRCTISGNHASGRDVGEGRGGGVFVLGGVTLTDCEVTNNAAADVGGGIFIVDSTASLTLANTRVSGNTARSGGGVFNSLGSIALLDGNLICGNTPNDCVGFDDPACQATCPA